MKKCLTIITVIVTINCLLSCTDTSTKTSSGSGTIVPESTMEEVYNEVKTPFRYGVVLKHPDTAKMVDSPGI